MAIAASVASRPLATRKPTSSAGTRTRLLDHDVHVEQHAERDEEDAHERVAQRQDVAHRAVAVLGVGDDHAAEERARARARARPARSARPCRCRAPGSPAGTPRGCGSRRPSRGLWARRSAPRRRCRPRRRPPCPSRTRCCGRRVARCAVAAPSSGTIEHHRHDAQVLEDQRADDEATVRSVELAALRRARAARWPCSRARRRSRRRRPRRAGCPSAMATPAATAVVRPT